ncbi:MAG: hypothetical protein AB7L13_05605 [Acidimicrobiia bacterium]
MSLSVSAGVAPSGAWEQLYDCPACGATLARLVHSDAMRCGSCATQWRHELGYVWEVRERTGGV